MNQNIQIVVAVIPGAGDGLQKYKLASVHQFDNDNSVMGFSDAHK